MNMISKKSVDLFEPLQTYKTFYEDEYATVSFVESIPCVKIKLSGVPHSSEHYQSVQDKVISLLERESINYCRLHFLSDQSKAGLVLEEDI